MLLNHKEISDKTFSQTEESISKKIIRNTIYNISGRFFNAIIWVFLTPYVIQRIGADRFGILAIVGGVTGYFGLLDLGIGVSFVKFIAEFYAKRDYEKINEVANSGFFFYLLFTGITIAFLPFVIHPLIKTLAIPNYLYDEAVFAFWGGIIIFSISSMASIFFAIQNGLQRMDIVNKLGILFSVPMVIGTIFFLEHGYGLRGLVINGVIIFVISSIANIIVAFRILPELKISPRLFREEMFKRLFGFGFKLQIARVSSMVCLNIDKFLIAYFLPIATVTTFQLGSSVVEQVKAVSLLFMSALIPACSEVNAKNGRAELIDVYTKSTKYLALVVIPLFVFAITCARQVMFIWMGAGHERAAWIIQILGIGWGCAVVVGGIRSVMVQTLAKTEIEMKSGLIAIIFNIPLSVILVVKFGLQGVAFGTSISLIISAIYGNMKLHKELNLSFWPFIKATILKIFAVSAFVGIVVWYIISASSNFWELNRVTAVFVFIIEAALFFAIYLILLTYVKPLDNADVNILSRGKMYFTRVLLEKLSQK
ncbi:MAG: oligosaccharide flippase family protein [Candidatus Omnitrophica bacterium]|nr:oligosaccharide flippase family protein [Candidatus Omnitrophota bacterium]